MLRIEKHGPITVFRMGRHVANRRWVLYETHAFLIDDTMIDTGTIAVRKEWETEARRAAGVRRSSTRTTTKTTSATIASSRIALAQRSMPIPGRSPSWRNPAASACSSIARWCGIRPTHPAAGRSESTVSTSRYRLQVIPTPGHCPDHSVFYEPVNGWLFAGDVFCGKEGRLFQGRRGFQPRRWNR